MEKPFFTVSQLAERLNVSEATVYRMIDEREVPFTKLPKGGFRFDQDEITTWLGALKGAVDGHQDK